MTAHLILGRNMNMHEQQFGYEKKLPTMSYEGTINGKYFFKMALTREDNILSGTLVNTYKKENDVYGTIDDEDSYLDSDPGNDGTVTDNFVDGDYKTDNTQDQDDHDIEIITIIIFK